MADSIAPVRGQGGAKLTWAEKGTRTSNRLRVYVARALLKDPESAAVPVMDAVKFLHRVADGREPASVETRTAASGALLRAGCAMAGDGKAPAAIDARQVHLHLGPGKPTMDDLATALRLLAGSQTEKAVGSAPEKANGHVMGRPT